jgi:hypothetical protein
VVAGEAITLLNAIVPELKNACTYLPSNVVTLVLDPAKLAKLADVGYDIKITPVPPFAPPAGYPLPAPPPPPPEFTLPARPGVRGVLGAVFGPLPPAPPPPLPPFEPVPA